MSSKYEKQLESQNEQLQKKLEEVEQHSDFRGDIAEVTVKAFMELDDIIIQQTSSSYFRTEVTSIVNDTIKKINTIYKEHSNE